MKKTDTFIFEKKGYTLIELLIFLTIFSIVMGTFVTILITILNIQNEQSGNATVSQQGQFLIQQIQYQVETAQLVGRSQDVTTSTLTMREFSPSLDPTTINVNNGTVYIQQGSGALQQLTGNDVSVSNLLFTYHENLSTSSVAYGTETVSFSFVMTATKSKGTGYSQSFQSSATLLFPVPKIALYQESATSSNSPSIPSLSIKYTTKNATGSLLLALVGNSTSSGSTNISDTASNTWQKLGNIKYPAYGENMALFAATNSTNNPNTVTASFGTPAAYASLYIYEYRGGATTSSFIGFTSQIQGATQNPSSGSITPSSSAVELLFSAIYNGNTAEIPTAGIGFTTESSSTVSNVTTEDMVQYATGPSVGTWQYFGSPPDSSVLFAVFH